MVVTEDGKEKEFQYSEADLRTGIYTDNNEEPAGWVNFLRNYRRELNQTRDTVDLESLWDSLAGTVEKLPFADLLDIYSGDREVPEYEALKLYWALNKTDVYFNSKEGFYYPSTETEVKEKLLQKEQQEKKNRRTRQTLKEEKRG